MSRIFLLSPPNSSGLRARALLDRRSRTELAARLSRDGAPLGEVGAYLSSLYFRGKLAYANAFAQAPAGSSGQYVITPDRGLLCASTRITLDDLAAFARVPIDLKEPRYVEPLVAAAREVRAQSGEQCEVVLLGSVATGKYVECLLPIFGERLLFPADFVGRGDMSRGGLMLRCVAAATELAYIPVRDAIRRGKRPRSWDGSEEGPRITRKIRRLKWIKEIVPGYRDGYAETSPVGSYAANRFGLFDMAGNACQWCEDWFEQGGGDRVSRGSGFSTGSRNNLLVSHRGHGPPEGSFGNTGFRCVPAPATSTATAPAPATP